MIKAGISSLAILCIAPSQRRINRRHQS